MLWDVPGISLCCYQDLLLFPGTFSSSQNTIVVGLVIGLLLLLTVIVITVTLKGKVQCPQLPAWQHVGCC